MANVNGILSTTPARSQCNISIEALAGEQNIIFQAIASTITIPFQPTVGVSGYRQHIQIQNNTTTGTFTLNGTDINGGTIAETVNIPLPPSQRLQSAQIGHFDYTSTSIFANATTITTTGAANAIIIMGAIQAGKTLIPCTFKSSNKRPIFSPNEQTGLIERTTKMLQENNEVEISELGQDLYPGNSLWWAYVHMGLPTIATIPSSPTVLFAATSISSSMTLTTQPSLPGMKLILTITGFTTLGILTITGINRYGQNVSETLTVTGAGVLYPIHLYKSVTTITNTGTVATLAVAGVYGWQYTFLSGGVQQTLAIENFDGSGSWLYPYSYFTEGTYETTVKGEAKISSKGMAQDKTAIGDRTAAVLTTNRIAPLTITNELPVVGWQTALFLDPITGTAGNTFVDKFSVMKLTLKTPVEAKFNLTNQQNFVRAFAMKREGDVEVTEDLFNLISYEMWRQNLKQYLVASIYAENIGTISGAAYYNSWSWTLPLKYNGEFSPTSDVSKSTVENQNKFACEYDPAIAASYRLIVTSQVPPTYNL